MSCGEAIQADATTCAKCGNEFARAPEPPPASDGDARTVAMHEVPAHIQQQELPPDDDEVPFVSKHGTVPLDPNDIPVEPPSSMGPGTLMMSTEQETVETAPTPPPAPRPAPRPAPPADEGEEKAPDSGGTQVMPQPDDAPAPGPPRPRRADPFAKTAKADGMTDEVKALRAEYHELIAQNRAQKAPEPAEEGAAPQHYSIPPGASKEPLPLTGEFPAHESLPDIAPPSLPRPTKEEDMSAPPPQQAAGDGMSMVAGTAKIVSEAFNSGFGASLPGWRTEVAAPMGMSTEGGKQALMPITLVNESAQRIAIGHADAANRRVLLKTHVSITRTYVKRYNRIWDVSPEQYAALLDTISAFFTAMQFEFVVEQGADAYPSLPPLRQLGQKRNFWLAVAITFTILSIILAIYAIVR